MPRIIADYRERSVIKELYNHKIGLEIKSLVVADFVLQVKDKKENLLNLGIERKTVRDFLSSMIDKRILKQLIALKENFPMQLLIIEGAEDIYRVGDFHPNAIRGMISSIAVDYQMPVIYTQGPADTAAYLALISRRLEKPKRIIGLLAKPKPKTLHEQQEFIIESIPGIGAVLAKYLLKKFRSIHNLANATIDELKEVELIGPKKSEMIRRVLDADYRG